MRVSDGHTRRARRARLAASLVAALVACAQPAHADDAPEPAEGAAPSVTPASAPEPVDADALRDVPAPSPASAEMLQSMREKGILSQEEYENLYRRQAIYEYEERQREKAPGWAQDWTVGGDLRVRLERIDSGDLKLSRVIPPSEQGLPDFLELPGDAVDFLNNRAVGQRDRARLRFRIGAERRLGDNWTVGFRIATAQEIGLSTDFGNDVTGVDLSKSVVDYRSSNVTMGDYFAPKGIYLDRAYLQFNPEFAPALKLVVGKFENPFRAKNFYGDMLVWDEDINPEGAVLKYRFDFVPETFWFDGALGFFVLEEIGAVTTTTLAPGIATTTLPDVDDRDPFILAYQGALHVEPTEWFKMGVRGAYYDYQNLSIRDAAILADLGNGGDAIEQNPLFSELPPLSTCQIDEQTGSRSSGCFFQRARSAGRVRQTVVDLYMRFRPFGEDWPITPFVQYTTLNSAETEPDGWGFGVQIGTPEILEFRAMWAQLDRNSTVALFTDSDLFDGFTNAKGWHVSLARKLSPNVTLRLTYYSAQVNQEMCVAVEEKGRPALFCDAATAQALNTAFDFRRASLDHRKRIQIDLTAEF